MRTRCILTRLFWSALTALLVIPAFALDEAKLKALDQLISESRFLSAWQLADRLDPLNSDLDLVIRKSQILQHSVIIPGSPVQFRLKDGLPLAGAADSALDSLTAVQYALVDNLQAQLKLYPANAGLWSLLGSAHWQFWKAAALSSDQGPVHVAAALEAYFKANQLGSNDGILLWRIGTLLSNIGDYTKAVSFLQQALVGMEKSADLRFDLAYALWLKGDFVLASEQAKQAKNVSKDGKLLAMCQLLLADISFSQKDFAAALVAFTDIYHQDPTNLYPLRRMIECNLAMGDSDALQQNTLQYAESVPVNPDSLYRLTMLFLQYQKQDVLFGVTRTLKQRYLKTRPEIAGLMAVYEAMVLAGTNRRVEALAALDEANSYLGTTYGPEHPVSLKIQELYGAVR